MPKTTSEEKCRWIKPILDKDISIKNMVKVCPFSERSLKYWLTNFREYGKTGLENKSRRPRSHSNETSIRVKERALEIRKETNLCAQKIHWKLRKEGIDLNVRTIGKILKREGLVRKYRSRKKKCLISKISLKPGELFEIDVKYVPKRVKNKRYYQFTAIDCASRWRYLKIYDDLSNYSAIRFLKAVTKKAPFKIKAVKTDNGCCFTNRYTGYKKSANPMTPRLHSFDILCQQFNIIHYLIDPGKPAQNGKVERSHRSDQEGFYERISFQTIDELEYKIRLWNMYYNDLEHCALDGLSPNQTLGLRVQNVCT